MSKPVSTIVLSLIVVGCIIGTHQTITLGFQESYWIFMLTFVLYLVYAYYRGKKDK